MNFNKEKHAVKVNKVFLISKSPICFMQSVFEVNFLLTPPGAVKIGPPNPWIHPTFSNQEYSDKKKKISESSQKQTGNYSWQLQSFLGIRGVLVTGPLTYTKSADYLDPYIKCSSTMNTIGPHYIHGFHIPRSNQLQVEISVHSWLNPWI